MDRSRISYPCIYQGQEFRCSKLSMYERSWLYPGYSNNPAQGSGGKHVTPSTLSSLVAAAVMSCPFPMRFVGCVAMPWSSVCKNCIGVRIHPLICRRSPTGRAEEGVPTSDGDRPMYKVLEYTLRIRPSTTNIQATPKAWSIVRICTAQNLKRE